MVLRDRDDNGGGGWSGASDGTLESRIYYAQNWRADVSAILSAAGVVKEWAKYSSYGVPTAIDPGDFDRDGFVTGDDNTAFDDAYTNGRPKADLDFDGYVTGDDNTLWDTYYSNGQNLGRGTLSRSDVNNRAGYAGYQLDPTFTGAPTSGGRFLYHVRHRVLDSGLGRWTRRDPLGYVDGMGLYEYARSLPTDRDDALGLSSLVGAPCPGKIRYEPSIHGCRCLRTGQFTKCPDTWGPCAPWRIVEVQSGICRCRNGGHWTPCPRPRENEEREKKKNKKKKPGKPGGPGIIEIIEIVDCAMTYDDCLDAAEDGYMHYLRMCDGLPTWDDKKKCWDDARNAYHIDVGICATEYAICSISELLPW